MAAIKLTLVVACALIDADKRVLIAQRPEGKALAGLWEFPGGKLEPGERPEQTLIRELPEEIGITVSEPCLARAHVFTGNHCIFTRFAPLAAWISKVEGGSLPFILTAV